MDEIIIRNYKSCLRDIIFNLVKSSSFSEMSFLGHLFKKVIYSF